MNDPHERLASLIEGHPVLAWWSIALSWVMGAANWFIGHAGVAAQLFGLFAAIFGCVAGWFTMRIQRRAWKRGQTTPPIPRD